MLLNLTTRRDCPPREEKRCRVRSTVCKALARHHYEALSRPLSSTRCLVRSQTGPAIRPVAFHPFAEGNHCTRPPSQCSESACGSVFCMTAAFWGEAHSGRPSLLACRDVRLSRWQSLRQATEDVSDEIWTEIGPAGFNIRVTLSVPSHSVPCPAEQNAWTR